MLSTQPDASLNCLSSCLFVGSISLNCVICDYIHIFSVTSMCCMQLLTWLIIFGLNSDVVWYWNSRVKRVPVLKEGLLLLLVLGQIVLSRFRTAFSLITICKGRTDVKCVVYLILLKTFVLLKCLDLLHVELVLSHCKLCLKHMLFGFESFN